MVDFGYRGGRSSLRLADVFDVTGYIDLLASTNLKWIALIGAAVAIIILSFTKLIGTGLPTVLFIIGMVLFFTYPSFLLMKITGIRRVRENIILYVLSFVISIIGSVLLPALSPVIGILAFVLAMGFAYPRRVTFLDAILVYVVLGIMGLLIMILTGASLIGALLVGGEMADSIVAMT